MKDEPCPTETAAKGSLNTIINHRARESGKSDSQPLSFCTKPNTSFLFVRIQNATESDNFNAFSDNLKT